MFGDFADRVPIVGFFVCVEGMNPGGAPDIVVFLGDAEGIVGIDGGGCDGDDTHHPCISGVIEDLVYPTGVVWKSEVRVGVDHVRMIGKLVGLGTIMMYGSTTHRNIEPVA